MRDPFERDAEFRRLIQGDEDVNLVRVNLEIARDAVLPISTNARSYLPDRRPGRSGPRALLDRGGARSVIGQINWVMFVEEGFGGTTEGLLRPSEQLSQRGSCRKLGLPDLAVGPLPEVARRAGIGDWIVSTCPCTSP